MLESLLVGLFLLFHNLLHVDLILFLVWLTWVGFESFFLLFKTSIREVDLSFNLESIVILLSLFWLDLLIVKQLLQLLLEKDSLVFREVVRVSLILLVEVLKNLILLIRVEIFKVNILLGFIVKVALLASSKGT